jgi:hypothetical protein
MIHLAWHHALEDLSALPLPAHAPSTAMGSQQQQHQQKDVVFDLDAASFSSDEFRMYQFKVCERLHCNQRPNQPRVAVQGKQQQKGTLPLQAVYFLPAAGEALPSLTAA